MPSWYVHIEAAAETLERLKAGVPAGSPLSQQQANDLFDAGHMFRNYLAAGALGPDLFFLLPDFKGDTGKGLLALVEFVLSTWKTIDDNFIAQWEQWMTPVLDNSSTLANSITGGMLGEIAQVQNAVTGGLTNLVLGGLGQMVDVFGLMSSGTQTGYEENSFFWSDMFHYRKTYAFARTLFQNASDPMQADAGKPPTEPSRVPKQQAFALGWMSHCATDVAGHPFTNAKCGGPYRTHWQRHHVVENHMDAFVYTTKHPALPMLNYDSLDTSALHFRLAFQKSATPAMPDDAPSHDYFPSSFAYPPYSEGEKAVDYADRKATFDVPTEALPDHLCQLLLKTMQDVYTGTDDMSGPHVLNWDAGKHVGMGGRPTAQLLKDTFQLAYDYVKYTTSSGLSPRTPMPPPLITDHDLPRPPGMPNDSSGANPNEAHDLTALDILLAIIAFAIYVLELAVWLATLAVNVLTDLATWPLRELLFSLLVTPAWDLYLLSRNPLVMEGFLAPRPSEISQGLVVLGADAAGALVQLRADLGTPSGFGPTAAMTEPSGLDSSRGATTMGFSLDPAYPRAMVTDLLPPWNDRTPPDADTGPSEFVAPWRYPAHNMAGMRNGWEAPRTHVGPYMQGQDATVLMGMAPGTDAARRTFELATTPELTEAASAALLPTPGAHLGDPLDYGAYLIGQLTGTWNSSGGTATYLANDDGHTLPDFNLDADRGYAYHCWDYLRHIPSRPPPNLNSVPAGMMAVPPDLDPDQWRCAPQLVTFLSTIAGQSSDQIAMAIRSLYGYQEPCTVPQRYDPRDNPHHRTTYDPLKRIAHAYLPADPMAAGCRTIDLWVSDEEIIEVGMSPAGRRVPGA